MKRRHIVLVLVFFVAFGVASCDGLDDPATILDGGNSLSSSEAAQVVVDELETRTFTDSVGLTHVCSEFVSSLIIGSWESDTESWLLAFTGTYEPGTRLSRFHEGDSTFDYVAGPPFAEACRVR